MGQEVLSVDLLGVRGKRGVDGEDRDRGLWHDGLAVWQQDGRIQETTDLDHVQDSAQHDADRGSVRMLPEVGLPPVEQEYGVAKVLLVGRLLPRLDLAAGGASARVEEPLGEGR